MSWSEVWNPANDAGLVGQERGRHDGKNGIFCAADFDVAVERYSTFDQQAIHANLFSPKTGKTISIKRSTRNNDPQVSCQILRQLFNRPACRTEKMGDWLGLIIAKLGHQCALRL